MNAAQRGEIERIIRVALVEDIGSGDVTTLSTVSDDTILHGSFIVKEHGTIAGIDLARMAYAIVDREIEFHPSAPDGTQVTTAQAFATVRGPGRSILSSERVVLNFMQRMSGIASTTRAYVNAIRGTKAVILDTRKTSPGLRAIDRWAVRIGGGQNHRSGLYDMALIKENHISAVGSLREAILRVRKNIGSHLPMQVEVRNLDELREALELKVERILLDNMSLVEIRKAVQITDGRAPLEASGNITLQTVAEIAATGVDFISVGALTHSVKALDLTFLLESSNGLD